MNIGKRQRPFTGNIVVPGDKSISHRALMLGAIADGTTVIENFLMSEDCLATIACLRQLGVEIDCHAGEVVVTGRGLHGLRQPADVLYTGNSGTTMRLLAGLLAGQDFGCTLDGDASLRRRPMLRVTEPLALMGATIVGRQAPLVITGARLGGICYELPIASAQVKSALLLAGLYARGRTEIVEPTATRDHTEIMLREFGAVVRRSGSTIGMEGGQRLRGRRISVPADLSTAAFLIAAALLVPNSAIEMHGVGINPTRTGFIDAAKAMGGEIIMKNVRRQDGEPIADIEVRYSTLRGMDIGGERVVRAIDEVPILAILAANAVGTTTIRNAAELRVKESDRIMATVAGLRAMGAEIYELDDGMIIQGGKAALRAASIDSYGDHRIAMAFAIAGLVAEGTTVIKDAECIAVSFPEFYSTLNSPLLP